jgi:hypothetical protein
MSSFTPSDFEPGRGSTVVAGCEARCDAEIQDCMKRSSEKDKCEASHQECTKECDSPGEVKPYSGLGRGELF